MRHLVLSKQLVIIYISFIAICIKLVVSPLVYGQLETDVGQIVNYFSDSLIVVSVVWGASSLYRGYAFVYIAAIATGITYYLATVFYTDKSGLLMLNMHLKVFLPLMLYPVLLKCYKCHPVEFIRAVKLIALLIVLLIICGILFLPQAFNRNEIWLSAYFGGLHPSAYVALTLIFIVYALFKLEKISWRLTVISIVALSGLILMGWGVRTAALSVIIFVMGLASMSLRIGNRQIFDFAPFLLASISVLAFFVVDNWSGVDALSSGRLSMYSAKYDQLTANGLGQWLIGNGYSSDLIETEVWWWAEKGAHSDLITMLVEGGIVYIISFSFVIHQLTRFQSWPFKCVIAAVIATAMFSNGIFVRPIAAYLLTISLVLLSSPRVVWKDNSRVER